MMAPADLLSQALLLPVEQRAAMAERLLASLPEDLDVPYVPDDDLEHEIARRIEDHRAGRAKTVDLETFKSNLRDARLRASQS